VLHRSTDRPAEPNWGLIHQQMKGGNHASINELNAIPLFTDAGPDRRHRHRRRPVRGFFRAGCAGRLGKFFNTNDGRGNGCRVHARHPVLGRHPVEPDLDAIVELEPNRRSRQPDRRSGRNAGRPRPPSPWGSPPRRKRRFVLVLRPNDVVVVDIDIDRSVRRDRDLVGRRRRIHIDQPGLLGRLAPKLGPAPSAHQRGRGMSGRPPPDSEDDAAAFIDMCRVIGKTTSNT